VTLVCSHQGLISLSYTYYINFSEKLHILFPRSKLFVMRVSVGRKHQKRVIFNAKIYYDLPRYQDGTYITKLYVFYSYKTHKDQICFLKLIDLKVWELKRCQYHLINQHKRSICSKKSRCSGIQS